MVVERLASGELASTFSLGAFECSYHRSFPLLFGSNSLSRTVSRGQARFKQGPKRVEPPVFSIGPRRRCGLDEAVNSDALAPMRLAVAEQRATVNGDVADRVRQAELAADVVDGCHTNRVRQAGLAVNVINGCRAYSLRHAHLAVEIMDRGRANCVRRTDLTVAIVDGGVADRLRHAAGGCSAARREHSDEAGEDTSRYDAAEFNR